MKIVELVQWATPELLIASIPWIIAFAGNANIGRLLTEGVSTLVSPDDARKRIVSNLDYYTTMFTIVVGAIGLIIRTVFTSALSQAIHVVIVLVFIVAIYGVVRMLSGKTINWYQETRVWKLWLTRSIPLFIFLCDQMIKTPATVTPITVPASPRVNASVPAIPVANSSRISPSHGVVRAAIAGISESTPTPLPAERTENP